MGWTLEERRDRVVTAALRLAADHGIEQVTLRAAAAEAGMPWDVARSSFDDQGDLLAAMNRRVSDLVVGAAAVTVPAGGEVGDALEAVALRLWDRVSASRAHRLLAYELALLGLRRTAMRPLVTAQHAGARDAAARILAAVAEQHAITWAHPVDDLARLVAASFDGLALAWAADADDAAARRQVVLLARSVATLAVPVVAPGDDGSPGDAAPR